MRSTAGLATDLKNEDSAKGDRSFPREDDQASERSDGGTSMLPRLIRIVKGNLSGTKRRLDGRDEDGGLGQRGSNRTAVNQATCCRQAPNGFRGKGDDKSGSIPENPSEDTIHQLAARRANGV
jgi:hypothetical protein